MKKQLKNIGLLFSGQILIKASNFFKQLLLAYYLGVSGRVDLLLVAQIIPNIIGSMLAGGAGEIIVIKSKSEQKQNSTFVSMFTLLITLLTAVILILYWFLLPILANKLDVKSEDYNLLFEITFFILLSKIPSAIVSCLQHLLYAKNLFRYFVISTLIAEFLGIITILLFVNKFHITAFAYGIFVSAFFNAIFFVVIHRLPILALFSLNNWKKNAQELNEMFKKVFSLGLQTMINYLSTLWERSLSFKYLKPGYLSALNYSKSVTELPKMAFLSSVLTTSYIEQIKRKEKSEKSYLDYTKKVDSLLNEVAIFFQLLSILFGPFIMIFLYKRGSFDTSDVLLTLSIYQILSIGFLPGLMMNFLTRTMFIESEMKHLFWVILSKSVFEIICMSLMILYVNQTIPIVLTISKFITVVYLYFYLNKKHPNMFNPKSSFWIYFLGITSSILIFFFNNSIIENIIDFSSGKLLLFYSPIFLVSIIACWYFILSIKKKIIA